MRIHNSLIIISLSLLSISCGSNLRKKHFSIKTPENKTNYTTGDILMAEIINSENLIIDSVSYFINEKYVQNEGVLKYEKKINSHKLGNHSLIAHVFYEGRTDTISKTYTVLHNQAPKIYSYKIIAEYPHDKKAFTQGLEFFGDTLYESTGLKGMSSLRKTNYKTGEAMITKDVAPEYFAEGITILNNNIYQLTWHAKEGFIYDIENLEKKGSFSYNTSKEGWGLCNDGKKIYKSDGTEKIWILNAETLAEEGYIQITTNKGVKSRFNELEWVEGKIYANTWKKDGIAIINPTTGALEGVINLKGLRKKVTQHERLDVLNGIAYKQDTKQLFVTGKNWDKLFEIEIINN